MDPKLTPRVYGVDPQQDMVLKGIQANRLHHGWLLTGPRGIGKATFAYSMARALLNTTPTFDLSPEDPVFRRVAAGSHGDLMVVEKKENKEIPIDAIRDIKEFMGKTPLEGGRRVVIVDSICESNIRAQNSLLKILEEPPENAILILVCHSMGKILPTIRSRVQKLSFHPLSQSDMTSVLGRPVPEDLMELCQGIPGKLLTYESLGGEALFSRLKDQLREAIRTPHKIPSDWQGFLGALDLKDHGPQTFAMVTDMMQCLLSKRIKAAVLSHKPGEQVLDSWYEIWDNVRELSERGVSSYLDLPRVLATLLDQSARQPSGSTP